MGNASIKIHPIDENYVNGWYYIGIYGSADKNEFGISINSEDASIL